MYTSYCKHFFQRISINIDKSDFYSIPIPYSIAYRWKNSAKFICYVNNNLWWHWISISSQNIYGLKRRCFAESSDYSSGFNRLIYCQCFHSSLLQQIHFVRRVIIKYYINNCGWSLGFGWHLALGGRNRREPIKSSFRLPVLRNRFFILTPEQDKKHLSRWMLRRGLWNVKISETTSHLQNVSRLSRFFLFRRASYHEKTNLICLLLSRKIETKL